MNDEPVISARNLSKTYRIWSSPEARLAHQFWSLIGQDRRAKASYRDFHAVSDISFELPKGSSLGIIGLNGSGKSTLLQMIAGTLQPTSGELKIRGRVAAMLELGAGFNPDFTGRENVYMNATVLGLSREEIDARFEAIAAFADIGDFIDQPVKTYSSGMYVRLGFAVLSQVDPEVLIIDEALSVGDFLFQQKCFDVMKEFRRKGVTFIFVSHSMGTVLELCTRAIVLDRSKMIYDGPAAKAVAVFEENAVRTRYGGKAAAPKELQAPTDARHGGDAKARPPGYILTQNVDQAALKAEPGAIYSPKVTFRFARFLDHDFEEKMLYRVGESMVISLGFRINSPLAEPHAGFKIRDKFGRIIFETSSHCMRHTPASAHAGEIFVANFQVNLSLVPGEYDLVVGFSEGSIGDRDYREALFYVQQIKTFTIVPNPSDIIWSGISHLQPRFGWSILKGDGR